MRHFRRLATTLLVAALALDMGGAVHAQGPCTPGAPVTFSYGGAPVPIADAPVDGPGPEAVAPINVSGLAGDVADVDFRFDGSACNTTAGSTTVGLDHTFVSDLQISLRGPAGIPQVLLINETDSSGHNFCQTVLDDESVGPSIQSVGTGDAPFTGSFTPNGPLSAFDGFFPNGTWNLVVQDTAALDTGTIRAFSLIITPCVGAVPTSPIWMVTITGVVLALLAMAQLRRRLNPTIS